MGRVSFWDRLLSLVPDSEEEIKSYVALYKTSGKLPTSSEELSDFFYTAYKTKKERWALQAFILMEKTIWGEKV